MSFQIKDGFGNAIDITLLDKEAADLWDVPVRDKFYASPLKDPEQEFLTTRDKLDFLKLRMLLNWYDTIGRIIQEIEAKDWETVTLHFLKPYSKHKIENVISHPHIKPTLDLINYWDKKGYVPFGKKD